MTTTEVLQFAAPARALPERRPDWPGLSADEAARRLAEEGRNQFPHEQPRGILGIAPEVAREPMFLMLVAAGSLYLVMGDPADALMLLGFVFVVMGITIVQERRTERVLQALQDLSSPRALVLRDGERVRIAGPEVVRGDVIVLSEGDRIPADALLREGGNVSVDESLLTGESVPVRKAPSADALSLDKPGGDGLASLFSGTLVTAGQGLAQVVATGAQTELGKIGKALQSVSREPTPLQRATGRLVRIMAGAALLLSGGSVIAYALTHGGSGAAWRQGALGGITMAMSILPEEFPVILTVFLALGAWRLSRRSVLTRRMAAVETLGAATVLCVDKTGTLTANQMSVAAIDQGGACFDTRKKGGLPLHFHPVLEAAVLASRPDPFDPMEAALAKAGKHYLPQFDDRELVREYPLTPDLLAMAHAWRTNGDEPLLVTAKGAPEAIAALCRLGGPQLAGVASRAIQLASEGLRVLGVAAARIPEAALPEHQRDLRLEFLGLVALQDPVRSSVPDAVARCRKAGIRVVMITGDYPATAHSIAVQAGVLTPSAILTGAELESLGAAQLAERVRKVNVFARVVPEQKLRIVEALRRNGEIVAMTGDGVNDAPALKAAHIGIAMGGRGTDVAREAAALVLLDDEFPSIVAAVELGRRIFDNIKKAFTYTIAVHVPIAALCTASVLVPGWPLLLLPVHIVFMELIIDPACSLIFEAEQAEPDVMRRPPRPARAQLFSAAGVAWGLLQGTGAFLLVLAVFVGARALGEPEPAARAATFTALVVANLLLILGNRSQLRSAFAMLSDRNTALWWVLGGTALLLLLALAVPGLHGIFQFATPSAPTLLLALVAGLATAPWLEALRRLRNGKAARAA